MKILHCGSGFNVYKRIPKCSTVKEIWDALEITYSEESAMEDERSTKVTPAKKSITDNLDYLGCFKCYKKDHVIKNFPMWGPSESKSDKEEESDDDSSLALMALDDKPPTDDTPEARVRRNNPSWILDSGCYRHVIGDRTWCMDVQAKVKEAMLIERLKRYEVPKVQGPEVEPHFLTEGESLEVLFLICICIGKSMKLSKVICKPCKPGQVQDYADEIARLSGGIPIQITGDDTIVFYRGRDYVQPEIMSPIDTLSKKRALEKSKYEQSLESVRRFIAIAEKELELYYRHVALYGDPSYRNAHSILDDSRRARERQNAEIGEETYSAS